MIVYSVQNVSVSLSSRPHCSEYGLSLILDSSCFIAFARIASCSSSTITLDYDFICGDDDYRLLAVSAPLNRAWAHGHAYC